MMRVLIFIVLMSFGSSVSCDTQTEPNSVTRYISIVSVLHQPQSFNGNALSIVGFLSRDQSTYIYLSRDHAILDDISSAIRVDSGSEIKVSCLERFVRITAKLSIAEDGEPVLTSVSRIWTTSDDGFGRIECLSD